MSDFFILYTREGSKVDTIQSTHGSLGGHSASVPAQRAELYLLLDSLQGESKVSRHVELVPSSMGGLCFSVLEVGWGGRMDGINM